MRSLAIIAIITAALAWLLNYAAQRIVLWLLVLMTLALSGCMWIAPDVHDDPPDVDLLCRPWWREACRYEGHGGLL